ncbi:PIR Superfamily Protein [Plasmodium ovale wallikeri]|uniref:PIR Superfamily Protein n=1 Tax=Plasmodium ovale wallikeri TaxID=864142 RepID=A0A1A9AA58_PLAOA|nr:PIR Superfamily Protein [Plasmodium ovale wallikeri]
MYNFCRNSPYYEMVVKNINREIDVQEKDEQKKGEVQKIKDACTSFSKDACSFENSFSEDICKKVLYMYKFLSKVQSLWKPPSTITNEDLNFLNYWLNVKLKYKSSNDSMCIRKFIEAIKSQGENFISVGINLNEHLRVIHPSKLENMELLYKLYDNARNILYMMKGEVHSDEEQKSCSDYTDDCSTKYRNAMDKCLNDDDDFYKALKDFKFSYIAIENETEDVNKCKSNSSFYLPEYDPVLERKQKKDMLIQNITTPLIVLYIIPFIYKFTPFGSFLHHFIFH